jgi:ADP-ribosyl-[dinitrogen reductase] hydrolase
MIVAPLGLRWRTVSFVESVDRAVGSLLGLALGEALGAHYVRRRASEIPAPAPFTSGHTGGATAMARNLARSLVDRGGFDPDDLIARHLAWLASDPQDVESLTRRVLERASRGTAAIDAAEAIWEERGPEVSAGNGSVMYCAPLGAAYANRPGELVALAPALSAITHFDQRCRTAVLAVTTAVASLVRGEPAGASRAASLSATKDREGGEELEYLIDAVGTARPIDGPDRGFCLFAAAAGLQALARGGTFEAEIRRVVSLGGDTAANAAVAGALVGAHVGEAGLPPTWLGRLVDREAIRTEALGLGPLAVAKAPPKSYTSGDH